MSVDGGNGEGGGLEVICFHNRLFSFHHLPLSHCTWMLRWICAFVWLVGWLVDQVCFVWVPFRSPIGLNRARQFVFQVYYVTDSIVNIFFINCIM